MTQVKAIVQGGSLQDIKEIYLEHHFKQVYCILSKHLSYAFHLMKTLHHTKVSKFKLHLHKMADSLRMLVQRRQRVTLKKLQRRLQHHKNLKKRASIIITNLLNSKFCALAAIFFLNLDIKRVNYGLAERRRHFLPIMLTNLNRNRLSVLSTALHKIMHCRVSFNQGQGKIQASAKIIRIMQQKKSKSYSVGFLAIKSCYLVQEGQVSSNADEEAIAVEVYRCMANNINHQLSQRSIGRSQIQLQVDDLSGLVEVLQDRRISLVSWAFEDIYRAGVSHYSVQKLQILQRQITILEEEYTSV